jgi:hypothetical protein
VELGEQKRKFQTHGQSSNTRPRFSSSQGSQFSSGESSGNYLQNSQLQRSTQQFQHSSISANKHHMFQIIIEIAQLHQYETTLQFTLMVVLIVDNWDIMPASAQIVTSRLPRKTMVKGSDNHYLRYVMEVQILRSTRVNKITCVAE